LTAVPKLAEASISPSGLEATEVTGLVCPCSTFVQ
jgi:hypothetical protein